MQGKSRADSWKTRKNLESSQKNLVVPGLQRGASSQNTARRRVPKPNSCSNIETV